jgi:hypothetical protein
MKGTRLWMAAGLLLAGGAGLWQLLTGARAPARPESASVPEAAAPAPPAVPPATPAARPTPAPPPPAVSAVATDEARAMTEIRAAVHPEPETALALIDAADRAHATSALAEERAALRVDALVAARRIGPARDAAEIFLQRYPRSARAEHVEMLTGVHPRPPEPEDEPAQGPAEEKR